MIRTCWTCLSVEEITPGVRWRIGTQRSELSKARHFCTQETSRGQLRTQRAGREQVPRGRERPRRTEKLKDGYERRTRHRFDGETSHARYYERRDIRKRYTGPNVGQQQLPFFAVARQRLSTQLQLHPHVVCFIWLTSIRWRYRHTPSSFRDKIHIHTRRHSQQGFR
jgi:hypothetical protein